MPEAGALAGVERRPSWATTTALAVLSAGYALQLFSPLRLNGDAVEYLWVAAALADGRPYVPVGGYVAAFPFGYPAVIAALDRTGLHGSRVIVGLNCLGLAVGLYFAYRVLRRQFGRSANAAAGLCALTMLSWTFVKHVTLPMSDMVFFGTSMACLDALVAAGESRGARRSALLLLAAVAAFASLKLRLLGVTLILAWIAVAALGPLRSLAPAAWRSRVWRVALLSAVGIGVAAGATAFFGTEYGRRLVDEVTKTAPAYALVDSLLYRLTELGELAVNAPVARVAWLAVLFPITGAIVAVAVARGAWLRRRRLGAADVYLASYVLILALWPFPDSRLWLPVVPLMMGYISVAVAASSRRLRPALAVYLGIFSILGVAALLYSTRLSLSGDRFGDLYAGGSMREIYRAAQEPPAPGVNGLDLKGISVLRRFR